MPEIVVAAESRTDTGKNANRRLRTRGLMPGVLYAPSKKAVPVAVSPKEIGSILRSAKGKVRTDPELVIAHVVAPRAEEAPAAVAEAGVAEGAEAATAEPEVIKKGKPLAEGEVAEEKPEKGEKREKPDKKEKAEKKEKK